MIEIKKRQLADFSEKFWDHLIRSASKQPALAMYHSTLINHTIQDADTITLHHSRRLSGFESDFELSSLKSKWTLRNDGALRVKMTLLASVLVFTGIGLSLVLLLTEQLFGFALVFVFASGFAIDRLSLSREAKDILYYIEEYRPQ